MTAAPLLGRLGVWVLDRRGEGRGVRVTRHPELGAINLSVWRASVCVGTVQLGPPEAAALIGALSEQLADLVASPPPPARPVHPAGRVEELEARLAQLEEHLRLPAWKRALSRVVDRRPAPAPPAPNRLRVVPPPR